MGMTHSEATEEQARRISCQCISSLLSSPTPLTKLAGLRDETIDRIYALVKNQGSPAAKTWLDQNAKSRSQARSIADQLLASLGQIKDDGPDAQVLAALALIRLAVSPVEGIFGKPELHDPLPSH